MRKLPALTLILAVTLPLTGEAPAAPSAEAVAEELWTKLQAVDWGKPYQEWQSVHASAACRESRSDADWGSADMQWCHRCREEQQAVSVESSFYAFSLDEPLACRLEQVHLSAVNLPAETLREAHGRLTALLTQRHGPPETPEEVSEFGSAYWRDVRHWRTPAGQIHLYLESERDDSSDAYSLDVLARSNIVLGAQAEDEKLTDLPWSLSRELDRQLAEVLLASYPQVAESLPREWRGGDHSAYQAEMYAATLRALEAARSAPEAQRPVLLLAADRLAERLGDMKRDSPEWRRWQEELSRHGLTYRWTELGASWVYGHELLRRVWGDYTDTQWGEQAFLLLLEMGWDTSPYCAEGSDQFRPVIEQGEAFLAERPESRYRRRVLFALAQAYETWWSLSRAGENQEYANPANYQEGAAAAREKAIAYHEEVLRLAPGSDEAAHARRQLPRLKLGIDTNQQRYFCVYD